MEYLNAFLCGGILCAIGQILIDKTQLTPARILTGYVVAGVLLSAVGLYQPLADWGGAGATVPLTGFGHALAKGVKKAVGEQGWLGVLTGGLTATAGGIAAAVFFGVYLINACVTFFTLEHIEALNIFMDGPREYGKYPFGIYGKPVLLVLTFLVPLALVQHWPLQYLFDRGPAWYGFLPVASLLFLIPCGLLWRMGVRHYCSTGS